MDRDRERVAAQLQTLRECVLFVWFGGFEQVLAQGLEHGVLAGLAGLVLEPLQGMGDQGERELALERPFGAIISAGDGQLVELQRLDAAAALRSEEHTSELQSLMRISYAVFCLKKKKH